MFSSNETVVLISINAWPEGKSLPPLPSDWRCKDISLTTITPSISLKNYYREKPVNSHLEQFSTLFVSLLIALSFVMSRYQQLSNQLVLMQFFLLVLG